MKFIKLFEEFNFNELSLEELKSTLLKYSVPVDTWGTGYAKTLQHLFDELKNDECDLREINGELTRFIEYIGVRILYKDQSGKILLLKEDRQEFKDGRVRRRNMPSSVSEKMKFGEDATLSAIRGIKEELDIDVDRVQLIKQRPHYYDGGSQSYPGLNSKYKGHHFTCFLTEEQFNPEGYVELQKDKSTFFIWVERN